jgi:hypothetical protein
VHVDGVPVPVTDNLWQALTGLRYLDRGRIIWVDALCIDQSDNERPDQVSHMNAIFTQASFVKIWHGPSYKGIEVALKFVTEFATGVIAEEEAALSTFLEDINFKIFSNKESNPESLDIPTREAIYLICALGDFGEMA